MTQAKLSVDMSVIMLLGDKLYTHGKLYTFIRETMQNSLDAQSTRIDVTCYLDTNSNSLDLSVKDNGIGIQDFNAYFFTIGGSSKQGNTSGTIGGYGIAKLAIMAMPNWSIQSVSGKVTKMDLIGGNEITSAERIEQRIYTLCPEYDHKP